MVGDRPVREIPRTGRRSVSGVPPSAAGPRYGKGGRGAPCHRHLGTSGPPGASGTRGLFQLAPRRLARQEGRPAGIPIGEPPSPLGRSRTELGAGGAQAEARPRAGTELRSGGPALATGRWAGRRGAGAGRPRQVPPNPRLLLTGGSRGGGRGGGCGR